MSRIKLFMRLLLHFAFVGWVKLHFRNTYQVIKVIKKKIQNNLPVGLDPGVSPICKKRGFKVMLWNFISSLTNASRKSNLVAPFSSHGNQWEFCYVTSRQWKQDFEKYLNQRNINKRGSHSSMDPALLEGRFCIFHETKYLPVFHFLKCRAETTTTKKKG